MNVTKNNMWGLIIIFQNNIFKKWMELSTAITLKRWKACSTNCVTSFLFAVFLSFCVIRTQRWVKQVNYKIRGARPLLTAMVKLCDIIRFWETNIYFGSLFQIFHTTFIRLFEYIVCQNAMVRNEWQSKATHTIVSREL